MLPQNVSELVELHGWESHVRRMEDDVTCLSYISLIKWHLRETYTYHKGDCDKRHRIPTLLFDTADFLLLAWQPLAAWHAWSVLMPTRSM